MNRPRMILGLLAAFTLQLTTFAGAQPEAGFKGLPLFEALRALQATGLRIVYSSAMVRPDLRVLSEPRGATPRQRLDELLSPHGLQIREGPGGILQVVRAPTQQKQGVTPPVASAPAIPPPRKHSEHVTVVEVAPYRTDRGVLTEVNLERNVVGDSRGSLVADPYRVVHAFPRVTAVDDFRSEFVVRGSSLRHVNHVIDGVSTPWLQHTVVGRGLTGSMSMLSGHLVNQVTLRTGAYPRRHADRLGAELELTLREGSRTKVALQGATDGGHVHVLAEGPLASQRGSWLLAGRQSLGPWPRGVSELGRTSFGFGDLVAKVVLDLGRAQRLAATAITGTSAVDDEDGRLPDESDEALNRASVVNISWELRHPHSVITQRGYVVWQQSLNDRQHTVDSAANAHEQFGYRLDVRRLLPGGVLEAGAQIGATAAEMPPSIDTSRSRVSTWIHSGYAHFAWAATPSVTVSPGVRVTSSSALRDPALSPWLLAEWSPRPRWSLSFSTGLSHQLPDIERPPVGALQRGLKPERATYFDIGMEHRAAAGFRWQVTVFRQSQTDLLDEGVSHPRFVSGTFVVRETARLTNDLRGTSTGIELVVERRRPRGLSGWLAYSYGLSQRTDAAGETYWSDFDQRHGLNVLAAYRFATHTSIAATFRAGSNFPVAGFFTVQDARVVVGGTRNSLRLPAYARLDLRGERRFQYLRIPVTPFVEVLNVLNRANRGNAPGTVDPASGEATGFTSVLLRRRFVAGALIEF